MSGSIQQILILVIVLAYTMYMGFNDGSLAISTTIVTRASKPKTALVIAAITKLIVPIVAFYIGTNVVANKLSEQMFTVGILPQGDVAFAFLFSGLIGAMTWAIVSYFLKLPISISHTLLGGIIGAGMICMGFSSINWMGYVLFNVVAMVFLAPFMAFILSFILLKIIKKIASKAPGRRAGNVLIWMQRINFVILSGSFASNNWQKSLGVLFMASAMGIMDFSGGVSVWIVAAISGAMMFGMLFGGTKIILTTGKKLFKVQPIHSVAAQLSASIIAEISNMSGIALGVGQAMTASIIGAGAADRVNAVQWRRARNILIGWSVTLPIASLIGAVIYIITASIMGIPVF